MICCADRHTRRGVLRHPRGVLEDLRRKGIRIAIDDFGGGYSALSYLRDLPIDEVKLDRSFIEPILVDQRAVVKLCHVLDLNSVVEGIGNAETAARVREYGCDVGQGHYCSRPVTSEELLELLRRQELASAKSS
ncbi:MAG TPA: EAL domain-containing protein [Mycobacterium sp.]